MTWLIWFSQQQAVRHVLTGILTGWGSAAAADFHAFRTWKTFDEAAAYGWRTAMWRWFQGALQGALWGAGLGSMLG